MTPNHSGKNRVYNAVLLLLMCAAAAGINAGCLKESSPTSGESLNNRAATMMTTTAETTVLLVRHGEKAQVEGSDPPLSEIGIKRANDLVRVAEDAGIAAIYCTQFQRTRLTAEPLAAKLNLPVTIVEANLQQPENFINQIAQEIETKHRGQTILVVSHSNTTPKIIERLSGKPAAPIGENEYDNLFIVRLPVPRNNNNGGGASSAAAAATIIKARF